jgi:hypothetical protein
MTNNQHDKPLPKAVIDLLVEDILESSDEEIIQEAQKEYGDATVHAHKTKKIIISAIIKSNKSRLVYAKQQIQKSHSDTLKGNVMSLSLVCKQQLIAQAKKSRSNLTLAARNADAMTECDIDSMLQDLLDLGVIDGEGNFK